MTSSNAPDLLTVAEAVRLLKVSRNTLHRWRKEGRLRAYHAGPKAVRFRRGDLEALLTPAPRAAVSRVKESQPTTITPLTDEQQQQVLDAVTASRAFQDQLLAKRDGQPFDASWPLIRAGREERSE